MKIHLHEWAKQQRLEVELYRLIALAADGLFKMIEWTLVLATLIFLADKTDSPLLNVLVYLCTMAIFFYLVTHLAYDLDFEIWPRPWTVPKFIATAAVHVFVGAGGAIIVTFVSSHVARQVAAAGIL